MNSKWYPSFTVQKKKKKLFQTHCIRVYRYVKPIFCKILRSMMEAQDQLERKYMSKKEEHRALEMQNYMGLSRNTGTFDPNRYEEHHFKDSPPAMCLNIYPYVCRQLEGDIFRIGMHLEDIKEMIDKTVYEQISLPHSSSTSTPITAQMKTVPFCTPSSPPHLHQVTHLLTYSCCFVATQRLVKAFDIKF